MKIVVSVGTDHHRFDRLVGWCDSWAQAHPEDEVYVQHGASSEPRVARGVAFLSPDELAAEFTAADVVVCQGGPATIAEARRAGHRPIVVPRKAAHREVVDDHQVRFAARLAQEGLVALAETEDELAALLAEARRDPATFDVKDDHDRTERSVRLLGDLIDALRP